MAEISTGLVITFSSGFLAEILDVSGPGASRVSIETSHMLTPANSHTFTPGDLTDWGEFTIEVAFDPGTKPPIQNAPEPITITWADSAASVWSFTGFMTSFDIGAALEERMTATVGIKISGDNAVT